MPTQLKLGGIVATITLKDIKNVHLSVHPPTGRVSISAPSRMSLDTIRVFAVSKLAWIKQQQKRLQSQEREAPREYLDRESHYVWGSRYLLKVIEKEAAPSVNLKHRRMLLSVRPGSAYQIKQTVIDAWYRTMLKAEMPALLAKWEPRLGVKVRHVFVQQMKTRWGSCNPHLKSIRLNTELAKKPVAYLEYIVVHEMMHLLEPTHSEQFVRLMDQHMPKWRFYRDELNRLAVRYEEWDTQNDAG